MVVWQDTQEKSDWKCIIFIIASLKKRCLGSKKYVLLDEHRDNKKNPTSTHIIILILVILILALGLVKIRRKCWESSLNTGHNVFPKHTSQVAWLLYTISWLPGYKSYVPRVPPLISSVQLSLVISSNFSNDGVTIKIKWMVEVL